MGKSKKAKSNLPNKVTEKQKKLYQKLKKCQSVIQSKPFQIGLIIFSTVWLIILIRTMLKIRKFTKEYETTELNERPFKIINFTIDFLSQILKEKNFKYHKAIILMERISRIPVNLTLNKIMTNVSINTNVVPILLQAMVDNSRACISNEGVSLLSKIVNTTGILIDAADRGLPFCEPKNVMKVLTNCPKEKLVYNTSIRLLSSFINNNNNKCAIKTVLAISNFARNYGKEEINDNLIDFIDGNINEQGSVNKEVCTFLSEYSSRDDLHTDKTSGKICSMIHKYGCAVDPNIESLCGNDAEDYESKEL